MGLAIAAFIVWKLMVNNAISTAIDKSHPFGKSRVTTETNDQKPRQTLAFQTFYDAGLETKERLIELITISLFCLEMGTLLRLVNNKAPPSSFKKLFTKCWFTKWL